MYLSVAAIAVTCAALIVVADIFRQAREIRAALDNHDEDQDDDTDDEDTGGTVTPFPPRP